MKIVQKNDENQLNLSTFLPKKDFVLLKGKIEVLGLDLFCGAVAYSDEKGLHFEPCSVIHPDPVLYNKLKDKKVGDIVHIERKRVKGAKHLKNDFTVNDVELSPQDKETTKSILGSFSPDYYSGKAVIL